MTILEKQSLRKKKSILYLVEHGEYSAGYALLKVEELHDNGKLIEEDYEELATYLFDIIENETAPNDIIEEPVEKTQEEPIEETSIEDGQPL